jgi:hypothetical protein
MSHDTIITGLAALQANGFACVSAELTTSGVSVSYMPVDRWVTGLQVFACVGCCPFLPASHRRSQPVEAIELARRSVKTSAGVR